MKYNARSIKTKQAIESAMVELLAQKDFNAITTTELAKAAGLTRQGFYLHYQDKYDMIQSYQEERFNYLEELLRETKVDNFRQALIKIFDFLSQDQLFAALILENGSHEMHVFLRNKLKLFIDKRLQQLSTKPTAPIENTYTSTYLSHAFFGIYQTWVAQGKKENSTDMTDYILSHIMIGL